MKKFTIIILLLILITGLTACKKGENDPSISLLTRKIRLTGEWKVKELVIEKIDSSGASEITKFKGSDVEVKLNTAEGSYTHNGEGKYIIEIFYNGKYEITNNKSLTENYYENEFLSVNNITEKGVWYWLSKK